MEWSGALGPPPTQSEEVIGESHDFHDPLRRLAPRKLPASDVVIGR